MEPQLHLICPWVVAILAIFAGLDSGLPLRNPDDGDGLPETNLWGDEGVGVGVGDLPKLPRPFGDKKLGPNIENGGPEWRDFSPLCVLNMGLGVKAGGP